MKEGPTSQKRHHYVTEVPPWPCCLAILAGVRYMIDHAPTREAVVLRIMLESGARVSEVLALTARGLRMAHNPKIGINVAAFVKQQGRSHAG